MSTLNADKFSEFFHAVHGNDPFPWQNRLLRRVLDARKGWPQAITLPTASGKTSCIDIALFALAVQADLPPESRTAPRRIAFVVDRRIIVDEASARAKKIADALAKNSNPIIQDVSRRLFMLAGDSAEAAIRIVALRGGVYRDQVWSTNPLQPLVLCSTVDQLGSRLLFRAYGASSGAWPIHAGLVGNDTLVLLDEAHIAEPFLQTANAISHYRSHAQQAIPAPFRFVVMSATPPEACTDRFPATDTELDPDRNHKILGARWSATKPTILSVADGTRPTDFVGKLADKLVKEAKKLQTDDRRTIAIVVNRVATAQKVAELLKGTPHLLLTGRMRPYDRDRIVAKAETDYSLSTNGAAKNPDRPPVFIVATQCLEVGADMDFDGIVSECASLDSLRQRFGRLNRGGRTIQARGTIVIRADQITAPSDEKNLDPVYGRALFETWAWLNTFPPDQLDFGIEALQPHLAALESTAAAKLRLEPRDAPVMLPSHLEAWSQTAPKPHCEPEPSLFLHGKNTSAPEISLCWRLDIAESDKEDALFDHLSLCPPASAECLSVPLWALRQWLASSNSEQTAKVLALESDDSSSEPDIKQPDSEVSLFAICWRGLSTEKSEPEDQSFILTSSDHLGRLRRGDTLIFSDYRSARFWLGPDIAGKDSPSSYLDIGDRVQHIVRARPTLRFHKALIAHWPIPATGATDELDWKNLLQPWLEAESIGPHLEELGMAKVRLQTILRNLQTCAQESQEHSWLMHTCAALHKEISDQRRLERAIHQPLPSAGFVLRSTSRYRLTAESEEDPVAEDSFSSSRSTQPVLLSTHSQAVAARATQHATAAGLPESIIRAFHLAGVLHDAGKADPRFQAMLIASSPGYIPAANEFLAKSARLPSNRRQAEAQRKAAGYPKGGRHELLSIRLAESVKALWQDIDEQDLVFHLIASHHGHCRPFAPVIDDSEGSSLTVTFPCGEHRLTYTAATSLESLDSGISERFWRLQARFGPWGLAWLEALFRTADQQISASVPITIAPPA